MIDAIGEDFHDLQGIDRDEDIHYPELPASSPEDESSRSHDKLGSLKSPSVALETLLPP